MTINLEVYYSFQSPYSYLALEAIYNLEKNYEIELLWQPFSAKAAGFPVTPSPVAPEKLSYYFEDASRYAKENNIPLVFPETWPQTEFEPGKVTRGAIVASDLGVLMEYNYKVFHKWWGLGEDPNDDSFMTELCDELDVEIGEFLGKLSSSDVRARVKGIYQRGRTLGIFDTPTFVLDNKERIVGIDKLHYLETRLTEMGLKRKAAVRLNA